MQYVWHFPPRFSWLDPGNGFDNINDDIFPIYFRQSLYFKNVYKQYFLLFPNAADIFIFVYKIYKVDRLNYDRYCRLFVSVQYTCFKARIAVLKTL